VKCLNVKRTTRNDMIVTDILYRRHAILWVKLLRLKSKLPSQDPVLPRSYLLEEMEPHKARKIGKIPDWVLAVDLETISCYNIFRDPSEKQKILQQKCDLLLDEISIMKEHDTPSPDKQSS